MSLQAQFVLEKIDDGHSPGATTTSTMIAKYDKSVNNFLAVFDNLLPDEWCDRAYMYSVDRKKPWGTYITNAEATNLSLSPDDLWNNGDYQRAISLLAVRALLFERGSGMLDTGLDYVHGTAVWCLCSGESASVNYHVDYAELYRYETNEIHPPLFAGTCHLSPLNCGPRPSPEMVGTMAGGDFQANVGGLNHYRRFGYKGRLASPEAIAADASSPDWVTVRYRRNRGILHDGNYPHQSTPVTSLSGRGRDGVPFQRVILGFNCFPVGLAECCGRAPEHSAAFNRTIRLYQAMARSGTPITAATVSGDAIGDSTYGGAAAVEGALPQPSTGEKVQGVAVADLQANPALARMLVLAARKVRNVRTSAT